MNAAVGALGERFLDGLLHALWPHRDGDHFAVLLFLQPQSFFERIRIGFIRLETNFGFANPRAPSMIARGASFAGTCLTKTPIFTADSRPWPQGPFPALEKQGRICPAEAERI